MLSAIGSFMMAAVMGLLILTGAACGSQATPPVADPSAVQSQEDPEPLAATPARPAEPESNAPLQEGSGPTPPARIATTGKTQADVEFLMTAALDALSDQDWSSELLQVALRMSSSGNTVYIPLIIDFMRIQFSQESRAAHGAYLTSLAGVEYEDIPTQQGRWGLWVE